MARRSKYSPEVRERFVAALRSILPDPRVGLSRIQLIRTLAKRRRVNSRPVQKRIAASAQAGMRGSGAVEHPGELHATPTCADGIFGRSGRGAA